MGQSTEQSSLTRYAEATELRGASPFNTVLRSFPVSNGPMGIIRDQYQSLCNQSGGSRCLWGSIHPMILLRPVAPSRGRPFVGPCSVTMMTPGPGPGHVLWPDPGSQMAGLGRCQVGQAPGPASCSETAGPPAPLPVAKPLQPARPRRGVDHRPDPPPQGGPAAMVIARRDARRAWARPKQAALATRDHNGTATSATSA